jgi:hypothetical protein
VLVKAGAALMAAVSRAKPAMDGRRRIRGRTAPTAEKRDTAAVGDACDKVAA